MNGGVLFSRIIPADKDRGFVLLTSWEKPVVQRSCYSMSTLSLPTQAGIDSMIAAVIKRSGAERVIDVTESGITKRLAKLFAAAAAPQEPTETQES